MAKKEDAKIMCCDFEINGTSIPKEAFELFALAQAKISQLRGYIIQVSENCFKGQLQGEGRLIEGFKKVIEAASEFVGAIKEFIIKNMKAIKDYTYETFEVKQNK